MRTTKGPGSAISSAVRSSVSGVPIIGPLASILGTAYDAYAPSNVKAGVRFALGNTDALDESIFTEEQYDVIRQAIENAKADGRNYVRYNDYPGDAQDLWGIVRDLGLSHMDLARLEGKQRPTLLDAMSDTGFNTITTLGQFTFDEDEEGYNIHDQFDFNYNDKSLDRAASDLGLTTDEYKDKYGNLLGLIDLYYDLRKAHADASEESIPYDEAWPGLPEEERQEKIQETKEYRRKRNMEFDKYNVIRKGIFPLLEDVMNREPVPIEASIPKNEDGGRVIKYNNGGKGPQFVQEGEVSKPPLDERIYEEVMRYLDSAPLEGWHRAEEIVDPETSDRFDALRHMLATSETVQELKEDRGYPAPLAMLAANLFGLGHEIKNFHGVRSAAEDLFNNFIGSIPATVSDDPEKIEKMIQMLSYFTPDGKDKTDEEYQR
jgi:hypothetical protein